MFGFLVGACAHVPDPPPESPPPTAGHSAAPTGVSPDEVCASIEEVSFGGPGREDVIAITALGGDGRWVGLWHDQRLDLHGADGDRIRAVPDGEYALTLARVRADGLALAASTLQGTSQLALGGLAAAADGGVWVAASGDALSTVGGEVLGGRGESDAAILRFGADGGLVWLRRVASGVDDAAVAVVADRDGGVWATGVSNGTPTAWVGEPDAEGLPGVRLQTWAWLVRASGDGALRWATGWGGADLTVPLALAAAPDGDVFWAGNVRDGRSSIGSAVVSASWVGTGVVARVSPGGEPRWVAEIGGSAPTALWADRDGVWAAGQASGTVTFGRGEPGETTFDWAESTAWVARWSGEGALRWAVAAPGVGTVAGLAPDGEGGAALAGAFSGALSIGDARWEAEDVTGFAARVTADGRWGCTQLLRPPDAESVVLPGVAVPVPGGLQLGGQVVGASTDPDHPAEQDAACWTLTWE